MLDKLQFNLIKKNADSGDLASQIELAFMYKEGKGVHPSFTNTLKYFAMAARKNHPEALFFLAECQDRGKGVPLSPENAFQNYLKAAKQGHIEANIAVAHFYELGRAVFKDLSKAIYFYEFAVSKGSVEARQKLENLLARVNEPLSSVSPLERIKSQTKS